MSDHTPTTQEVMEQWREQWSYDHDENGKEPRDAQFHRWLAQHDAEVTKTERERIVSLVKEVWDGRCSPVMEPDECSVCWLVDGIIKKIRGENE
jgi:hypothetical protein